MGMVGLSSSQLNTVLQILQLKRSTVFKAEGFVLRMIRVVVSIAFVGKNWMDTIIKILIGLDVIMSVRLEGAQACGSCSLLQKAQILYPGPAAEQHQFWTLHPVPAALPCSSEIGERIESELEMVAGNSLSMSETLLLDLKVSGFIPLVSKHKLLSYFSFL